MPSYVSWSQTSLFISVHGTKLLPVSPGFFFLYLSSPHSFLYFGSSSHCCLPPLASSVHPLAHAVLFPRRLKTEVSSSCPHCLLRSNPSPRVSASLLKASGSCQLLWNCISPEPPWLHCSVTRSDLLTSPQWLQPYCLCTSSFLPRYYYSLSLIPFGKRCLILQDLIRLLPLLWWPNVSYLSFIAHIVPCTLSILVPITSHLLFICLSQFLIPET